MPRHPRRLLHDYLLTESTQRQSSNVARVQIKNIVSLPPHRCLPMTPGLHYDSSAAEDFRREIILNSREGAPASSASAEAASSTKKEEEEEGNDIDGAQPTHHSGVSEGTMKVITDDFPHRWQRCHTQSHVLHGKESAGRIADVYEEESEDDDVAAAQAAEDMSSEPSLSQHQRCQYTPVLLHHCTRVDDAHRGRNATMPEACATRHRVVNYCEAALSKPTYKDAGAAAFHEDSSQTPRDSSETSDELHFSDSDTTTAAEQSIVSPRAQFFVTGNARAEPRKLHDCRSSSTTAAWALLAGQNNNQCCSITSATLATTEAAIGCRTRFMRASAYAEHCAQRRRGCQHTSWFERVFLQRARHHHCSAVRFENHESASIISSEKGTVGVPWVLAGDVYLQTVLGQCATDCHATTAKEQAFYNEIMQVLRSTTVSSPSPLLQQQRGGIEQDRCQGSKSQNLDAISEAIATAVRVSQYYAYHRDVDAPVRDGQSESVCEATAVSPDALWVSQCESSRHPRRRSRVSAGLSSCGSCATPRKVGIRHCRLKSVAFEKGRERKEIPPARWCSITDEEEDDEGERL